MFILHSSSYLLNGRTKFPYDRRGTLQARSIFCLASVASVPRDIYHVTVKYLNNEKVETTIELINKQEINREILYCSRSEAFQHVCNVTLFKCTIQLNIY